MRAAFVILAHEGFDRVAELVRYLVRQGAPVVVHIDRQIGATKLASARAAIGNAVTVISTRRTVWGQFGLVEATLDAVQTLLGQSDEFTHVALLSGTCLPIRPIADLDDLLKKNPDTDFIESVPAAGAQWVQDGLSEERFTLWHPFPWRTKRMLFDLNVEVQRRLGVRRKIPAGLEPHLGLQWWCLTRATLERIVALPELESHAQFFRSTWIPDESFFQTLVRFHGVGEVESRSLTLQRFDAFGRPFVFHDDHADLLGAADNFFARKIDPDANGLYKRFLNSEATRVTRRSVDLTPFAEAHDRHQAAGQGVAHTGRVRRANHALRIISVRPYLVFLGEDSARLRALREQLLAADPEIRFHGLLFGERDSEFADYGELYSGNISNFHGLRNYRPAQFLRQILWADRADRTALLFHLWDNQQVESQLCRDHNARVVVISDRPVADVIRDLRRPAPVRVPRRRKLRLRRRRPPKVSELNAWIRSLDATDRDAELAMARDILLGDWSDPTGWTVPDIGGMR